MECIRGAVTVAENEKEEILSRTEMLLKEIFAANGLEKEKVRAVLFTATRDLDAAYPAVAARRLGLTGAALMCMQEMYVAGSLPRCIRVLVTAEGHRSPSALHPIYLGGAAALRPDLTAPYAVAIDGPAGSGKSTVAKALAEALQIVYVDTGAMYRAVGLYCLRQGMNPAEEAQVAAALPQIQIDVRLEGGTQRIYLNGEDVSEAIRSPEAGQAASDVGTLLPVRQRLVAMQQELAKNQSVVMDGRDIGTCVLPGALLKVFLVADPAERAKRRLGDFLAKGETTDFETVYQQLLERDQNDANREHSPLRKAADALEVDTTGIGVDRVVEILLGLVRERLESRRTGTV